MHLLRTWVEIYSHLTLTVHQMTSVCTDMLLITFNNYNMRLLAGHETNCCELESSRFERTQRQCDRNLSDETDQLELEPDRGTSVFSNAIEPIITWPMDCHNWPSDAANARASDSALISTNASLAVLVIASPSVANNIRQLSHTIEVDCRNGQT